jgi:hypothetical protein
MGIAYNTSVVRDGLVLHLDAANVKSYPGSGTNVIDLSGNEHHCALNNGTSVVSDPVPVFSFDGDNDTITTNANQTYITNTLSVEIFVKVSTHGNYNDFVSNNWVSSGWLLYSDTAYWRFAIAQNGTQYNSGNILHNNNSEWVHLVGSYDNSSVNLYVNGILQGSNSDAPDNATLDSNVVIRFGQGGEPGPYKMGIIRLYNRALSANEVSQNFEALRGRYGI